MNKLITEGRRGPRRMQRIIAKYENAEKLTYREKTDLYKIIPGLKNLNYKSILKRVPTHQLGT